MHAGCISGEKLVTAETFTFLLFEDLTAEIERLSPQDPYRSDVQMPEMES